MIGPREHGVSTIYSLLITVGVVFLASLLLNRWFQSQSSLFHVLDYPNHRSLHELPKPRSGGVGIVVSMLLGFFLVWQLGPGLGFGSVGWLIAGTIVLAVVGYIDDRVQLGVLPRLIAQSIAGGFILIAGWGINELPLPGDIRVALPLPISAGLTLLTVVWMANLYNFMDGMDGNAAGMAVFGFAGYALLGQQAGDALFTLVALLVIAASAGFLVWNLPPARIFMGDAGSLALGYLAAGMGMWGVAGELFSIWVAIVLFSPFIVDASFTLVRRLLRGERVWEAHREHLYQRLVQVGWTHRRTLFWAYSLMIFSVATAIVMNAWSVNRQWLVMGIMSLIYFALIQGVSMVEKSNDARPGAR